MTKLMGILGLEFADGETSEDEKSSLAFTPDGNMTLIDDFLQIEALATEDTEQMEKQFITLQSKNGNTFYIVIDRNGDTENVYFMNLVDEADLMALREDENGETAAPACSCADKCVVGAINTSCEVCRSNMSECTGKEDVSEPEPTEPTEETRGCQERLQSHAGPYPPACRRCRRRCVLVQVPQAQDQNLRGQ